MSLPNVATLYQQIAKGAEGGHEFARIMRFLLIADFNSRVERLESESDASGDYRHVDAYTTYNDNTNTLLSGFQFKFYPSKLSHQQRSDIIHSLQGALGENKAMQEFILVTPEDFMKEDQAWFDSIREEYKKNRSYSHNGETFAYTFNLSHWGHSRIIELCLKHEHVGRTIFPQLFPFEEGKFRLSKASIDSKNSNWEQSDKLGYRYWQSFQKSRRGISSDPIFDFQFTNDSVTTFLLEKIEIHIEKIETQLHGIPADYFLSSIETFIHEMDFTKRINVFEFADPLIFKPKNPLRFKLRLKNFRKKCPGNYVVLKFWIHFRNHSIPTEPFSLSF